MPAPSSEPPQPHRRGATPRPRGPGAARVQPRGLSVVRRRPGGRPEVRGGLAARRRFSETRVRSPGSEVEALRLVQQADRLAQPAGPGWRTSRSRRGGSSTAAVSAARPAASAQAPSSDFQDVVTTGRAARCEGPPGGRVGAAAVRCPPRARGRGYARGRRRTAPAGALRQRPQTAAPPPRPGAGRFAGTRRLGPRPPGAGFSVRPRSPAALFSVVPVVPRRAPRTRRPGQHSPPVSAGCRRRGRWTVTGGRGRSQAAGLLLGDAEVGPRSGGSRGAGSVGEVQGGAQRGRHGVDGM